MSHLRTGQFCLTGFMVLALCLGTWAARADMIEVAGDTGSGSGTAKLGFDDITVLPAHQLATTTSATEGIMQFEGVLMRDLLALIGAEGGTVLAGALNDYEVEIPMEDFQRFDVILAHTMNGERLRPRDKGPYWIVYPRDQHPELQDIRYDYRWVWQLNRLEIR